MDLTQDVIYRGYKLNDADILTNIAAGAGPATGIAGCVIDSVDFSDVDVVQFLEKRSLQDGMDAGDVFLGARRLRMAGTLYAISRALLFDAYWALRAVLSPVLAQYDEPADKGYQPLYFMTPTNRLTDYPSGYIDLRVLALPRSFQAIIQRDSLGGNDLDALAVSWQATFVCKDPSIMGETPQDYVFTTSTIVEGATATATTDLVSKGTHGLVANDRISFTTLTGGEGLSTGVGYWVISDGLTTEVFKVSTSMGGSAEDITVDYTDVHYVKSAPFAGNFTNRGNYLCPLNMLVVVGATAGSIAIATGGAVNTITVPASTGERIVRYNGQEKTVSVEENSVETLRLDLLAFGTTTTHPLVPTGTSAYTVTFTGVTVGEGSHMWFWERYA